jgi:hypothetical protein
MVDRWFGFATLQRGVLRSGSAPAAKLTLLPSFMG